MVSPPLWLALWRGSVLVMAVLAPLLAAARAARAVRNGSAEDEFGRWFRAGEGASLTADRRAR